MIIYYLVILIVVWQLELRSGGPGIHILWLSEALGAEFMYGVGFEWIQKYTSKDDTVGRVRLNGVPKSIE